MIGIESVKSRYCKDHGFIDGPLKYNAKALVYHRLIILHWKYLYEPLVKNLFTEWYLIKILKFNCKQTMLFQTRSQRRWNSPSPKQWDGNDGGRPRIDSRRAWRISAEKKAAKIPNHIHLISTRRTWKGFFQNSLSGRFYKVRDDIYHYLYMYGMSQYPHDIVKNV